MANNGDFVNGLGYLGQKLVGGTVGAVEGIWDFAAAGIAELFGNHEFAVERMNNDWIDYDAPDNWFQPNDTWKFFGDVAGGVGNSVPSILLGLATLGAGFLPSLGATFGMSFLSAGGNAVKEAAKEQGDLNGEAWAYGALSGLLEGSIETISAGLGVGGLGASLKAAGKGAAKGAGSKLVSTLWDGFKGEFVEEAISAALTPYIKRATYDENAQNASLGEVLYSGIVGGLSGMITSGVAYGKNKVLDKIRGGKIAGDEKKLSRILTLAKNINKIEGNENVDTSPVFQEVKKTYKELEESLKNTGGQITTAEQREKLGYLNRKLGESALYPEIVRAAATLLADPNATVENINNFYNEEKITLDELTKGLPDTNISSKKFKKNIYKALGNNDTLRNLTVMQALGQLSMNAQKYANAMFGDTPISNVATQENINRFVESEDPDVVNAVSSALGIDMYTATADQLAAALGQARLNKSGAQYESGVKAIKAARSAPAAKRELPTVITRQKNGAVRYKLGDSEVAIIKDGDKYRLFDFATGNLSKEMNASEIIELTKSLKKSVASSETSNKGENASLDAENAKNDKKTVSRKELNKAVKDFCNKNVPEYKRLTESEKSSVRMTVRQALMQGMSETDAALLGRIAAQSGMNINVRDDIEGEDVFYDGNNGIYVNASANNKDIYRGLLGKEMFKKLFKDDKGGKDLYKKAIKNVDPDKKKEILNKYKERCKDLNLSDEEIKSVSSEEAANAYAEELLGIDGVWEYILAEEPSFKDRVLNFFKRKTKSFLTDKVGDEAEKWLEKYKKYFLGLSKTNKSQGGFENSVRRYTVINEKEDSELNFKGVLNSKGENGKINNNDTEADEDGERVRLRDGSERSGSENTEGQIPGVEEDTGEIEGGQKESRYADSEAARLADEGQEVKLLEIGITQATPESRIKLISPENDTTLMKAARKMAKERGVKVAFFAGSNMNLTTSDGQEMSVRGYISADGRKVFIRADHPRYTSEQLMRHELGHDMIAKGEVNTAEVKERLEKIVGKENIDKVAELYAEAYAGTGMTAEEIFEEFVCDSLGDMNIFSEKNAKKLLGKVIPEAKKAASESKEPSKTRGPPEGKASRETDLEGNPIYETEKHIAEPTDFKALQQSRRIADEKYGLSKIQSRHLEAYVRGMAYLANQRLLDGSVSTSDLKYIQSIIEAVKKFPTYEGRTYRNLRFRNEMDYNAFLDENSQGDVIELKSITSTSKSPNGYPLFGKYVIHMVYDGVSGRDIADTYGIHKQQEVIYLPGVSYKVDSFTTANDGHPLIYVKEIANNEVQIGKGNNDGQKSESFRNGENDRRVSGREGNDGRRVLLRDGRGTRDAGVGGGDEIYITDNLKGKASRELDTEVKAPVDGMAVKAKAEYTNDRVFNKSEALTAIRSIKGAEQLMAKEREALAVRLWVGLNQKVTEKNRQKQLADLTDKLYEDMSNMLNSEDATEVIKLKIRISDAVKDLYKNGGHESKKAKIETREKNIDEEIKNTSNAIYDDKERRFESMKERDREKDKTREAYYKATLALDRTVRSLRKKIEGDKFTNATVYKDATLKKLLSEVLAFEYRETFSTNKVREKVGNLLKWYNKDNPAFLYNNENDPGIYLESVRNTIEALSNGKGQMTSDELRALDGVIKYMAHTAETFDQVYLNDKWASGKDLSERFIKEIKTNEKVLKGDVVLHRNRYIAAFGTPETVMLGADGFTDGFFTTMYKSLREGEVNADIAVMEISREVEDFLGDKKNKKYVKSLTERNVDLDGAKLTKIELIGYYMTLKREQSWETLAYNGFVVTDESGKDIKISGLSEVKKDLTQKQLEDLAAQKRNEISELLTENDRKLISLLEAAYKTTKELKINADITRFGIENVIDGYYYPLKRKYLGTKTIDPSAEASYVDRFTYASYNKHTKDHAQQPLFIGSALDTFYNHIRGIAYYANVSPVIDSYNKLYKLNMSGNPNDTTTIETVLSQSKSTWRDKNGQVIGNKYFKDLVYNIENGSYARNDVGGGAIARIRGGAAVSALALNPKVWVTQFSSLLASSSMLSKRALVRGTFGVSGADVDKYCKLAELRNREHTVVKAQGVIDKVSGIGEILTKPISFFDRRVIKRLFASCQAEVELQGGAKIGTEDNKIAAGKMLENIILETQQNSFVTSKTSVARNGGEFLKGLMMFKSDAVQVQGKIINEKGRIMAIKKRLADKTLTDSERIKLKSELKKVKKNGRKAIGALVASATFMLAVSHTFKHIYNKDKEEFGGALFEWIGNLLGGLPGIADVYEYFVNGYDLENMEMSAINDLLSAATSAYDFVEKLISGKAEARDTAGIAKKLAFASGQALGLPFRNVYNTTTGLIRRFDETAGYKIDDFFKKQNYEKDYAEEAKKGKNELAKDILSMAFEENIGEGASDETLTEFVRLANTKYNVVPSEIAKSITIDGESYELTEDEREIVREIYSEAIPQLNKLIASRSYQKLDDKQRQKKIKDLLSRYRKMGYDEVKETSYGVSTDNSSTSKYSGMFKNKGSKSGKTNLYSGLFGSKTTSASKKSPYASLLSGKRA